MVGYFYIKNLFNGFFYAVYPRVTKLDHFTVCKDYVIVVPVKIRFFVVRLVLPKLMFAHQTTFQKQFYCIIKCRAAHAIIFVLHIYVKRLNIKMVVVVINFLKNGVAFRRFTVSFFLKKTCENVLYYCLIVYVCF